MKKKNNLLVLSKKTDLNDTQGHWQSYGGLKVLMNLNGKLLTWPKKTLSVVSLWDVCTLFNKEDY